MIDHATVVGVGKGEGTACVGVEFSPFLAAVAAGHKEVHTLFPSLIAQIVVGTEGIELFGCYSTEVIGEFLHRGDIAPKFVT